MLLKYFWNRKAKPFYFRVLIYGGLFQILLVCYIYSNPRVKKPPIFREVDTTNNYMSVCALPVYDYWHPDVMRVFQKGYDSAATCQKDFRPYTKLENGVWSIEGERNCSARCIEGKGDHETKLGEWMPPGPVSCEFLEAVCWDNEQEIYGFIHTQIIAKKPQITPPKFKNPPNVFVFLMDSMSTGQAKRSLPKTLSYLSSKLQSVEFPFVNKVGKNSRPNGLALWTGKLNEPARAEQFGGVNMEADWNETMNCHSPIENFTIFKEFAEHGYMTLHMDDWHPQMINYPNCRGYSDTPIHHYMRAFYETYRNKGTEITKSHLKGQYCREPHHPAFEYFQQFVEAYKDVPKFSWMWLNSPGHNRFNGLQKMDTQLINLFNKNRELLENSFVFFMGDHGFQMGLLSFVQSPIGDLETSNPYLSVSIPKILRKNDNSSILVTLRENAKKLQTHFDTRATLLDISKFQPNASFTDRNLLTIPNEKGHSLLRRQPSFPRTCGRLPIPSGYCICQMEKVSINDENLQQHYVQKLLEHLHKTLADSNSLSKCEEFQLSHVVSLHKYGHLNQTNHRQNYEITVRMKAPSIAVFHTSFSDHNGHVIFGPVERRDRYGNTADCANNGLIEKFCFCRNLTWKQRWNHWFWSHLLEMNTVLEGVMPRFLLPG